MEVGKAFIYSGGATQWKPPTVRLIPDRPTPFSFAVKGLGGLVPKIEVPRINVAKITGIEGVAAGLGARLAGEPLKGFAKFLAYQIQRSKAFKLGQLAKGALGPWLRRLRSFAPQLGLALARKLKALKVVVPPEVRRALKKAWPPGAVRTRPRLRERASSITTTGPPMPKWAPFAPRRMPP